MDAVLKEIGQTRAPSEPGRNPEAGYYHEQQHPNHAQMEISDHRPSEGGNQTPASRPSETSLAMPKHSSPQQGVTKEESAEKPTLGPSVGAHHGVAALSLTHALRKIQDLDAQNNALKDALARERAQHKAAVATLEEKHRAGLAEAEARHDSTVASLKGIIAELKECVCVSKEALQSTQLNPRKGTASLALGHGESRAPIGTSVAPSEAAAHAHPHVAWQESSSSTLTSSSSAERGWQASASLASASYSTTSTQGSVTPRPHATSAFDGCSDGATLQRHQSTPRRRRNGAAFQEVKVSWCIVARTVQRLRLVHRGSAVCKCMLPWLLFCLFASPRDFWYLHSHRCSLRPHTDRSSKPKPS